MPSKASNRNDTHHLKKEKEKEKESNGEQRGKEIEQERFKYVYDL
jgi:hypothetical protein